MTRKLLAVVAAGLLAAVAPTAQAQFNTSLSLAGGLSIPSGSLKNGVSVGDPQTDNGYNLAAGLNFGAPLIPVGVRVEAGYNSFNFKGLAAGYSASQNIMSGTVNATVGMGLPYVIGGVGYYSTKINASGPGAANSDRENTFGINGGVGMRFPLGVISTFAEIRYHKLMGSDNATSNTKPPANGAYIPVTFGINF